MSEDPRILMSPWRPWAGCVPLSSMDSACVDCPALKDLRQLHEKAEREGEGNSMGQLGTVFRLPSEEGMPAQWTGKTVLWPGRLETPHALPWAVKTPTLVRLDPYGDLFSEAASPQLLLRAFAMMAICRQHTFVLPTRYTQRMAAWFNNPLLGKTSKLQALAESATELLVRAGIKKPSVRLSMTGNDDHEGGTYELRWPLTNVWACAVADTQRAVRTRGRDLLATRAHKRVLKLEGARKGVSLARLLLCPTCKGVGKHKQFSPLDPSSVLLLNCPHCAGEKVLARGLFDWVLVEGEPELSAGGLDVETAATLVEECRVAGVKLWIESLGSTWAASVQSQSRIGDVLSEWPEEIRVRQAPNGIPRSALRERGASQAVTWEKKKRARKNKSEPAGATGSPVPPEEPRP